MQKMQKSSSETINAAVQSNDKLVETLEINKKLKCFQTEIADHIKQLYSSYSIHVFEMICDFERQLLVEYKVAYENPDDVLSSVVCHMRIQGDFSNNQIRETKLKEVHLPGDILCIFSEIDSIRLKY